MSLSRVAILPHHDPSIPFVAAFKDSPQDSNADVWNHKLGLRSANPKTATSLPWQRPLSGDCAA